MSKPGKPPMRDFSIDLETLDTKYNAAILSIGVQQFNIDTSQLGATFYREIDLYTSLKSGMVGGETLTWWMQQDAKAKRVFGTENKTALSTALYDLREYMRKECSDPKGPRVWGNGATLDISILEYAYEHGAVGQGPAWDFREIRDMRTLMDAAGYDRGTNWPFPRVGTHHNALDDAIYQAKAISQAWQEIRYGVARNWAEKNGATGAPAKNEVEKPISTDKKIKTSAVLPAAQQDDEL